MAKWKTRIVVPVTAFGLAAGGVIAVGPWASAGETGAATGVPASARAAVARTAAAQAPGDAAAERTCTATAYPVESSSVGYFQAAMQITCTEETVIEPTLIVFVKYEDGTVRTQFNETYPTVTGTDTDLIYDYVPCKPGTTYSYQTHAYGGLDGGDWWVVAETEYIPVTC